MANRVPIAIIRFVPLTRWSCWSGGASVSVASPRRPGASQTCLLERLRLSAGRSGAAPRSARRVAGGRARRQLRRDRGREAAATARSSPTIVRGAEQELGDVGGASSVRGARGGGVEVGDRDAVAVSSRSLRRSSAPWATCARCSAADWLPDVVEHGVGDLGRLAVVEAWPVERAGDEQGSARARRCPRPPRSGTGTPARSARSIDVGLVLDLLEPGEVDARAAVLVHEEAPRLGDELGVGLVAARGRGP